jgi:hypothetical protein
MEASVRTGRQKTNNLQHADDTTMPAENREIRSSWQKESKTEVKVLVLN